MRGSGRRWSWVIVAVVVLLAIVLYVHFDLGSKLSLGFLKQSRDGLLATEHAHPLSTMAGFFALYVAMAALSIPGATILTLASGAIFGFRTGLVVVSFAAAIGATLAFLTSRYLLRDPVRAHFSRRLATVDEGMAKGGAFYLLTLRLIPAFPFFVVNLLMGITAIPLLRYYWVSQLGMLPAIAIYVNAGTQLATIERLSDVLSPTLLGSFVLLGLFPLLARSAIAFFRARKVYRGWKRPARFDRNLIVIGAGSGGLVTAYIAAAVNAEVTLIEAHAMGGDCLNTGCVPSKTLIHAARAARVRRTADPSSDDAPDGDAFTAAMARVHAAIERIAPHDSIARYRGLGVDAVHGHARIVSPWAVEIDGHGGKQVVTARSIVVATGSSPAVPSLPGIEASGYLTSETLWGLTELPRRIVVLGGGPIGCELAQSFAQFGARVVLVERGAALLAKEDPEVSVSIADALRGDDVEVLLEHEVLRCERVTDERRIVVRRVVDRKSDADAGNSATEERTIAYDALLVAVGRVPRVAGFGLEQLGVRLSKGGTIEHDAYLRTNFPNIYTVGDVAGPWQFTHTASHQAWYAAVNALFGGFRRFRVDDRAIPWATFTDPEVARVGLSETQAREREIDVEVTRYPYDRSDRAIVDDTTRGSIKVLTAKGHDRILGVVIVGAHASEMLAEYVLAIKHGLGLKKILGTIHVYPTFSEIDRSVAGVWQTDHRPRRLLAVAQRFHRWMRT